MEDTSFITETPALFESRKADHIRLALSDETQAHGLSGLDRVRLRHEALPEIDFDDVSIATEVFGRPASSPMFISSMTAGHAGSGDLNLVMARVSEKRNWLMGVGSQRKQLTSREAADEWKNIRKSCPRVRFLGNIGIAQVIQSSVDDIRRLTDSLEAEALFVHLNPLQECLQPEGTPKFRGAHEALSRLVREIGLPVVVKETGCGFSAKTLERLRGMGLAAVDVSGNGGTHWGRVEGGRSGQGSIRREAAETFRDWGVGTVESMTNALRVHGDFAVWASGGVRSGLDAAKLCAMGASMVGLAQPILKAAMNGGGGPSEEALDKKMATLEFEMRTALFCTGASSVGELQGMKAWDLT